MTDIEHLIVGAGISGLANAVRSRAEGTSVRVWEAGPQAGGVIRSVRDQGYLCELGPNTLMVNEPGVRGLLEKYRMWETAMDAAPQARKRFVVQGGKLVPITPLNLFRILGLGGMVRLMGEPFCQRGVNPEEPLAQFAGRRLGQKALEELLGPFVSGIHAGDPERLITRHAFPRLYTLEQTHGSLSRALIFGPRRKMRRRLISWAGGMQELPDGLAKELGTDLCLNHPVDRIEKTREGYRVFGTGGGLTCQKLTLATESASAARLLTGLGIETGLLAEIPHAPMAVIHLGLDRSRITHPLDGFGFLISRRRGIRTLGMLFSSALFPGRAPEGKVLLTGFIGGRMDPTVLDMADDRLIRQVLEDVRPLLGIRGGAEFARVTRWPRAIPQYEAGHGRVVESCEELGRQFPGLHLAGSYRGGIALGDRLRG
ncbi:MAG: protoporphyrinogen oxidase [Verrucomicrobiae bacterium]|nr:protoporphyrinogen oxidase [Verrucomicrobiae bacterium]